MLEVRALTKTFGALRASDGIDLAVREGETHAIIGPNGAGKTTFIGQLAGNLRPDSGRILFAGEDVTRLSAPKRARKGLARSFQITSIYPEFSVLDNVALAVQAHAGHSFRFWGAARADRRLRDPAQRVLDEVGLGARSGVLAANLSHGEQRNLEIGIALATEPQLLCLDEPTAGMSAAETQVTMALVRRIAEQLTILIVEHDMQVVMGLAQRITVLHYGRVLAEGTPADIQENPRVLEVYLKT
ncbi:MAG: ABC transporter ATP-binding protein [Xanthobacteraceae bacterium]